MQVIDTEIHDVKIVQPKVLGDDRGFFLEVYEKRRYQQLLGIKEEFVQDNYSRSRMGVLRGMHFQAKHPQGKLVRVVHGEVFDVAVDIRPDSPSFKKWTGAFLTAENKQQLWIPPGLAHGFLVLSDFADFEYKCTDYYYPQYERCLRWDDPHIAINWPITDDMEIILSDKDHLGKRLTDLFE